MSAQQKADPTKTTPANSRVWHIAADIAEHAKAKAGEPFRTRCGLTSGRSKRGERSPRKARELSPMEPCVVCRSLAGAR